MSELVHEFNTGDLVYMATATKVDRDVIKAIRFEGLKNKVSYAFKSNGSYLFYLALGNDGYNWFSANEVFATEEEAEKAQQQLHIKEEAERAKAKIKEIARLEDDIKERKEALRRKKLGIEDSDEYDD